MKEKDRVGPDLPAYEGPSVQTSIRMPQALKERLEVVAKETGHTLATVIVEWCRWAQGEWESNRGKKK